jgi:hypothetical protein
MKLTLTTVWGLTNAVISISTETWFRNSIHHYVCVVPAVFYLNIQAPTNDVFM